MAHRYPFSFRSPKVTTRFRTGYPLATLLLLSGLSWGQCFKPAININAANGHIALGDFNGDGKPDFVTTQSPYNQDLYRYTDSIAIFLNRGGGLFDKGTRFLVGRYADSLAVGDLNADGKLDVAVTNSYQSVAILLGDGKGGLATPTTLGLSGHGYPATRVLINDLNSDGYPDLAVAGLYDSVTVLLNNGQASFGRGIKYSAGKSTQIRHIKTGDFNGDGKPDLILLQDNYYDYFVSLLLNNGSGIFGQAILIKDEVFRNANATEVGDFNGDGKPDLIVIGDSIAVLLNNGTKGFVINKIGNPNRSRSNNTFVAINDFNNDGKVDLALPGYVLAGNGNGLFGAPVSFAYAAGNPYGGFLTGDFDANGQPDLLAGANPRVSVFLNCTVPINTVPIPTDNDSQTATVGLPFSYTVNAFSNVETPNSLTYAASLSPANGLNFDATTRLISGTPSMSGVTSVTITATDPGGLSATTSFTVTVKPPVILGTDEPGTDGFTVFPNPATDRVQLVLDNGYRGAVLVQLVSAVGQRLQSHTSVKTTDRWQHTLAVQELAAGTYYISLYQNGQQTVRRLFTR